MTFSDVETDVFAIYYKKKIFKILLRTLTEQALCRKQKTDKNCLKLFQVT